MLVPVIFEVNVDEKIFRLADFFIVSFLFDDKSKLGDNVP